MRSQLTSIKVISLPKAADRRKKFVASCTGTFTNWEFFDGHTECQGPLKLNEQLVYERFGRKLQAGEIGVYSSHFALWQWLIKSSFEQLIVFEDDVVVDWPFIKLISGIPFKNKGIEYLRLFAKMPSPWRLVASPYIDKYRHLIRFTGYPLGAQAYCITKSGAEKFVKYGSTIEAPIDIFMDRHWTHGLMNLAIYPFPIYERYQKSSIGDSRLKLNNTSLMNHNLSSIMFRICQKIFLKWSIYGISPLEEYYLKKKISKR